MSLSVIISSLGFCYKGSNAHSCLIQRRGSLYPLCLHHQSVCTGNPLTVLATPRLPFIKEFDDDEPRLILTKPQAVLPPSISLIYSGRTHQEAFRCSSTLLKSGLFCISVPFLLDGFCSHQNTWPGSSQSGMHVWL